MNTKDIIDFYLDGNSLKSCHRKFKISEYKIKKILNNNNIAIRNRGEQLILENIRRSKNVNHSFFNELNTTNVYIIGFLAGDGYVHPTRNLIKIGLSAKDRLFLETIKKTMNIERDILEYQTNKGYDVIELSFSSVLIKQTLAKYSVINNKTTKGVTMQQIPSDLKWHYIRGFFDADGSYYYNNTHRVKISSFHPRILNEIQDFVKKGTIYHLTKNRNIYSFELNGDDAIFFMNNIYQGKCLYLPRKYKKFIENYNTHETGTPQNEDEKVC